MSSTYSVKTNDPGGAPQSLIEIIPIQTRTVGDGAGTVTVSCSFLPKLISVVGQIGNDGSSIGNCMGSLVFGDQTCMYWHSLAGNTQASFQYCFYCQDASGIWYGVINNFTSNSFDIVYDIVGTPGNSVGLYIKIQG